MRVRFWHEKPARQPEAEQAAKEAQELLKAARARWPLVRRQAEWARGASAHNHLTDLFFELRGGKS